MELGSPPLVIFLADKARPFLQSKQVTEALYLALVSKESTSFFLLSSEYDPDSLLPPSLPRRPLLCIITTSLSMAGCWRHHRRRPPKEEGGKGGEEQEGRGCRT